MLLTQRKFLPLFLTQFLGALNDNLLKMAIITFITYHLQGSLTEKGILISSVNVITILPMFFISATAGQFADKFQRNSLVKIIKGIEILGIFFCIFFFYSGQYSLILLTLFVMSTRSAFFWTTEIFYFTATFERSGIDFRQRFRGYIDLFSSLVRNDFRNLSTFPYLCFGIFVQ